MKEGDLVRVKASALLGEYRAANKSAVDNHGWLWTIVRPRSSNIGELYAARSLATGYHMSWLVEELETVDDE
jgi:hypothetical protein